MAGDLGELCKKEPYYTKEHFREDMQRTYFLLVEDGRLSTAKVLSNLTGIKPELPEGFVQNEYKRYVKIGALASLRALKNFTNVQPILSEETKKDLQRRYDDLILRQSTDIIPAWEEATGVKAVYPNRN